MIKGLSHIGISVKDLDRSIRFYRDLLGMDLVAEERFAGPQYEQILALPGARGRVALVKRSSLALELFEFEQPAPMPADLLRPVCDHGITHFCVEVDDIETEYSRLEAAGVVFHCPVIEFPWAAKAVYARDPDGNVFELLQST